jgi:hypothetical protein
MIADELSIPQRLWFGYEPWVLVSSIVFAAAPLNNLWPTNEDNMRSSFIGYFGPEMLKSEPRLSWMNVFGPYGRPRALVSFRCVFSVLCTNKGVCRHRLPRILLGIWVSWFHSNNWVPSNLFAIVRDLAMRSRRKDLTRTFQVQCDS